MTSSTAAILINACASLIQAIASLIAVLRRRK